MPYKSRVDLYAAQKRHRVKVRQKLLEYLSARECIDCGENDPIVLEFDHRNPEEKSRTVARFLSGHNSWESVKKEIEKCEVRCANCHRRKSYKQFGHWGKTKAPIA
jgi:hypothetical protein